MNKITVAVWKEISYSSTKKLVEFLVFLLLLTRKTKKQP